MAKESEKKPKEKKVKTLKDIPKPNALKVELTFTEQLLATMAGNKQLATDFIAEKHPDEIQADEAEAIANIDEEIEKQTTIFAKEDGRPFIWDYQVKGFFKDACLMMLRITKIDELKAYKKIIDGLLFVKPRKIFLDLASELTIEERPLRAQTAQGERIALARSEAAPIGTKIQIEIATLNPKLLDKYIINWLDYGILRGLGQWRNSGKGRFTWREIK